MITSCVPKVPKNNCPRAYEGDLKNYEIRKRHNSWNIGIKKLNSWTPLKCSPGLNPNFLSATNNQILHTDGQAYTGKSASFIFYPSIGVPQKTIFNVNSENLFGDNKLEINLSRTGKILLNEKTYQKFKLLVNGIRVIIFSEPNNPSKESAVHALKVLSDLFPKRTQAIIAEGEIQIILARNSTEEFQPAPIRPNGKHDYNSRFVVLFSQNGLEADEHIFHEIGGLFRIPRNSYAHGLTWMIAFDQMEKRADSPALKLNRQCLGLKKVISNLVKSAGEDFSHPIEFYMMDVFRRKGWPIYSWGSAFYWKKINTILTEKEIPNIYNLLNYLHKNGSQDNARDLDQLLFTYKRMNPSGFKTFEKLTTKYFRESSLKELLIEARKEETGLGCNSLKRK